MESHGDLLFCTPTVPVKEAVEECLVKEQMCEQGSVNRKGWQGSSELATSGGFTPPGPEGAGREP